MVFIILTNINKNKAIPKPAALSPVRPPFSCHFGSRGSGGAEKHAEKKYAKIETDNRPCTYARGCFWPFQK